MKYRLAAIIPAYALLILGCLTGAYLLRFDFNAERIAAQGLLKLFPFVFAVKAVLCIAWGEWKGSYRFPTVFDLVRMGAFATTASAILFATNGMIPGIPGMPRGVILGDAALTLLALGSLRVAYRTWNEVLLPTAQKHRRPRALILSVGAESIGILRMLNSAELSCRPFRIRGFVNTGRLTHRSQIGGLPVYDVNAGWPKIAEKSKATDLLIPGSLPGKAVRELLVECATLNIKVHIIPAVNELVGGRFKLSVRDVTVSDLLRREPNRLDMELIRDYVTDRRVVVTGGAGSIGSELCRQLLGLSPEALVIYDQSEFGVFTMEQELKKKFPNSNIQYVVADILDEERLNQVFSTFEPHLVFHAAAYKHVPLMEDNPQSAVVNNVLGTKAVADAAHRHKVERFVQVSTDKAVRPTSVMGATKLVAEKYIQSLSQHSETRFITVRFGNVLNSMGSVVPTFRQQIEAGGPITVTDPEMRRFFMTIPEAVQLVIQAGAVGSTGEILILDMGEPVKIVDLARDMIILSGLKYPDDIDIVFTGMRPGEKLYEELFYTSEKGAKKVHDKIFAGDHEAIRPMVQVLADIRRLEEAADESAIAALKTLQGIVRSYSETEWVPSRLRIAA
jgi:FlaA1/EpsC-like NDP-sugar epimerase